MKALGKFRKFLETKTIPYGECFQYAYQTMRKLEKEQNKEGIVVHATVHDPWDKHPYEHAWLEVDGKCLDWQSMVMNRTGPRSIKKFYEMYQPVNIRRFNGEEAMISLARNGHYGPWEAFRSNLGSKTARKTRKFIEEWDQEDFDRRHRYAELPLVLDPLPAGAWVSYEVSPKVDLPFYVKVEFSRRVGPQDHYTTVIIPYPSGQLGAAKKAALDLLQRNENRYTRAGAFRQSRYVGQGIDYRQSDREYYRPR